MTHPSLTKIILLGAVIFWPIITLSGYFLGQCWYYDCGKWLLLQSLPGIGTLAVLVLIIANTFLFLKHRKLLKKLFYVTSLILVTTMVLLKSRILYRSIYHKDIPDIEDRFACSDNCPGPISQYQEKVFQGVENPWECLILGGRPSIYIGWGTFPICKVHWFKTTTSSGQIDSTDNIFVDPESGQKVLIDELTILASGQNITELIKPYGGTITTSVIETDSYQVKFPVTNLSELNVIKSQIEKHGVTVMLTIVLD